MSSKKGHEKGRKGAKAAQKVSKDPPKEKEGVEALSSELDKMSNGSDVDETAANGADDANQYFETEPVGPLNGQAPTLTDQEREELTQELKKTEDEIQTLRQVLQARMKHSNELKRKLGLTPWMEFQNEFSSALKNVQESNAYQKTTGAVMSTSESITNKLGQLKNSNAFKSFEDRVGTAYSSVKAKIAASTSIDNFYGAGGSNQGSQPGTGANTPSTEKSPLS